jgi:hypothetical protein
VRDITPPQINIPNVVSGIEENPIVFNASRSSDNTDIYEYYWDFGDGTVVNSSVSWIKHVYFQPRVYNLKLVISDFAGNKNTTNITVDVQKDTDRDLLIDLVDQDDDGDKMLDDWEIKYNLDPLNPIDATFDYDGDGINNFDEYIGNTNPRSYDITMYTLSIVLVITILATIIFFSIFKYRQSRN